MIADRRSYDVRWVTVTSKYRVDRPTPADWTSTGRDWLWTVAGCQLASGPRSRAKSSRPSRRQSRRAADDPSLPFVDFMTFRLRLIFLRIIRWCRRASRLSLFDHYAVLFVLCNSGIIPRRPIISLSRLSFLSVYSRHRRSTAILLLGSVGVISVPCIAYRKRYHQRQRYINESWRCHCRKLELVMWGHETAHR